MEWMTVAVVWGVAEAGAVMLSALEGAVGRSGGQGTGPGSHPVDTDEPNYET